jgi:hypothetical protein
LITTQTSSILKTKIMKLKAVHHFKLAYTIGWLTSSAMPKSCNVSNCLFCRICTRDEFIWIRDTIQTNSIPFQKVTVLITFYVSASMKIKCMFTLKLESYANVSNTLILLTSVEGQNAYQRVVSISCSIKATSVVRFTWSKQVSTAWKNSIQLT